jgi:hypothetical protein
MKKIFDSGVTWFTLAITVVTSAFLFFAFLENRRHEENKLVCEADTETYVEYQACMRSR